MGQSVSYQNNSITDVKIPSVIYVIFSMIIK